MPFFPRCVILPKASMYDIFTYIYHKHQPSVGIYTVHGWYGLGSVYNQWTKFHTRSVSPLVIVCSGSMIPSPNGGANWWFTMVESKTQLIYTEIPLNKHKLYDSQTPLPTETHAPHKFRAIKLTWATIIHFDYLIGIWKKTKVYEIFPT